MAKILILHVEAGFGHRKVAESIASELQSRYGGDLQIRVADALHWTNTLFRKTYPEIYFHMVVRVPWLWKFFYYATNRRLIYAFIRPLRSLWNRLQGHKLTRFLREENFDVILFTHFFPAEICATAKKRGILKSQLVTVVTDVIPHSVWRNPGTDCYWVMAEESAEVLAKDGIPDERIQTKGIPVGSEFLVKQDRNSLRAKFGLEPNRLTLLFSSGSFGSGPTEEVLNSFKDFHSSIQAIVVCGRNEHLHQTLSKRRFPFPLVVFGFVHNMHEIMSASDLLVAKPGGATMCESLVKGLPMIILAPIPGQESYNAKWLAAHQASFQISMHTEIRDIVSQLISRPEKFEIMRRSIKQIARPDATRNIAEFIFQSINHA